MWPAMKKTDDEDEWTDADYNAMMLRLSFAESAVGSLNLLEQAADVVTVSKSFAEGRDALIRNIERICSEEETDEIAGHYDRAARFFLELKDAGYTDRMARFVLDQIVEIRKWFNDRSYESGLDYTLVLYQNSLEDMVNLMSVLALDLTYYNFGPVLLKSYADAYDHDFWDLYEKYQEYFRPVVAEKITDDPVKADLNELLECGEGLKIPECRRVWCLEDSNLSEEMESYLETLAARYSQIREKDGPFPGVGAVLDRMEATQRWNPMFAKLVNESLAGPVGKDWAAAWNFYISLADQAAEGIERSKKRKEDLDQEAYEALFDLIAFTGLLYNEPLRIKILGF